MHNDNLGFSSMVELLNRRVNCGYFQGKESCDRCGDPKNCPEKQPAPGNDKAGT